MHAAKKVLVTRPLHQSGQLCKLIALQGWQAIRFPVLEIQARPLSAQDMMRLQNIAGYHYVFFVSANAVNFARQIFNGKIAALQQVACITVGKATHTALADFGVNNALLPAQGFNSEAILAMPELQELTNKSCLIIRGVGGRELLAKSLTSRGADVDYLEVYERVLPKSNCQRVEEQIQKEQLSAIFIYSGDALNNLLQLLGKQSIRKALLKTTLVVISQRVKVLAQQIGFKKIIIAEQASDLGMVNALLNGEECG